MYYSLSDFPSDSSFSSISSICGNADATSAKSFSVSYCAIPIGWVNRFLPWITGKYGDTKIFVLVVLEQTPCLHSLILQVSLAELAVPLIWQVALAKLEKSDTLQQIFSCSLGCVPNTLCHRGNESKDLLIIGLLPVFPNLFVPASL